MTDTAAPSNDPAQPADAAAAPVDKPAANAPEGGELAADDVDKTAANEADDATPTTEVDDGLTLDVYATIDTPEGMGDEQMQALKDTAAQFDMTLEQAQQLADVTAKQAQEVAAEREQWDTDWKKHPKFGGTDENLTTSAGLIDMAQRRFDPNGKLGELLKATGHGEHPAVREFFAMVGSAMRPGTGVPASGAPAAKPLSEEQQKYPNMFDKDGNPLSS